MPPPLHRRLTATEHLRIREYRLQGLSYDAIAAEIGCPSHQVAKSLRKLLAEVTRPIPITRSQHLTILRFRESGLNSLFVAAHLQVDAAILYRELAAYKPMSTQRMGLLKKLFEESTPTEKIPKKRGRPLGSRHD
jgi:hypothetical protein